MPTDHFEEALKLIRVGRLDEARIYLEELLRQDPENTDLLYNLGLCYIDLGQIEKGIELLHRCLQPPTCLRGSGAGLPAGG